MNRPIALAILLLAAQNATSTYVLAANPPASASYSRAAQQRRYMPKWVYYDRLGLAAWNKGERPTAKTHWEYAMSLCENDLRGRPKGALDKQTKLWVNDLIQHMTFLMTYYDQPKPEALKGMDIKTAMIKSKQAVVDDIDRKLQWFDKLESFAKMLVGKECYLVQDFRMLRRKQLMMQEQYRREICDLKGELYVAKNANPNGAITIIDDRKAVKKPSWWKNEPDIPSWRHDYLRVGQDVKPAKSGKPTTGTKPAQTGHYWRDKGDKPEIPGVSYVGGKQIKRQESPLDGHLYRQTQGDSSPLWGQNPYNEMNRPNKWGTQAERDPSMDLNSKAKAPNWGENNTPKDTSVSGWGNNGGPSQNPDGTPLVNPNGTTYWK